jgi:hypothetical protein
VGFGLLVEVAHGLRDGGRAWLLLVQTAGERGDRLRDILADLSRRGAWRTSIQDACDPLVYA